MANNDVFSALSKKTENSGISAVSGLTEMFGLSVNAYRFFVSLFVGVQPRLLASSKLILTPLCRGCLNLPVSSK